jgi:hypothetical protein
MSVRPASAWFVLAAWLGLMAGVGASLRPASPRVLPAVEAHALASAWSGVVKGAAPGRPALYLGKIDCACDAGARRTVTDWAQTEALELREAPGLSGIALADSEGRLRYAGDPAALTVHCGGLRGFRAWWTAPAQEPVLTAPCACA